MRIDITVDSGPVARALARLASAASDLEPAMKSVSGILESQAQASFEREAAPDGERWADLSDVTKARRAARRKWPGRILQVGGDLAGSITAAHGRDFAAAGTNVAYAPTHQFGARKGQFGRTARGAPIPWGDIPARPFLGLSRDGEDDVLDAIGRHLERALR